MAGVELQPDIHEVMQQEEGPGPRVPVCIDQQSVPLRTQALPRKAGATQTRILTTTAQRYLRADHRRARATVISTDATSAGTFLVAFNEASAQDPSTMAVWPGATQLTVDADTEVWLAAAASTVTVGILTELWAEGE